jgi:hypothetical protein
MLKPEVVEAVAAGRFHIWAVRSVDEGIELLTGVPAGERQPDGSFPVGSVHALVQQGLVGLATRLVEFGQGRPNRRKQSSSMRENGRTVMHGYVMHS